MAFAACFMMTEFKSLVGLFDKLEIAILIADSET